MKTRIAIFAWLALAALLAGCQTAGVELAPPRAPSLIPYPAHLALRDGGFAVTAETPMVCPAGEADCGWIADYLAGLLKRSRGLALKTETGAAADAIRLEIDPSEKTGAEGYRLTVAPGGVRVAAAARAGLFYGAVTLWQLLTEEQGHAARIELAAMDIDDAPRFAWRGLMLDSARHFQPPDFVKSFIDAMAREKLNLLQWHLTDDQGWRIEIKRYPKLTSVGAWRVPAGPAPHADIDPATGKPRLYGGFYTQDEIRDIVAYARARNVTIVPEIEMPGHAMAAIVAYPGLGSVANPPAAVSSDWGIFPYLYNADDSTFDFLENVLSEVMALFPSPYIHIGGDEAVKDQWKASPEVQARMRALGIKSEDALQGYFTARIGKFLAAHGRRLIGWDEILEGGVPPDAAITSWRGIDGAVAAAKAGHDAVLAPAPTLYFDNRQAEGANEPPGRGAIVTLKQVYDFDPAPAALTPDQQAHILGVQGNIWTEYIRVPDLVDYAAFPRAAALAETGWSPASAHNWQSFLTRLPAELARYRALGLTHSESAFAVTAKARAAKRGARVTLSTQTGFGAIRYTLDGSAPGRHSRLYRKPFAVALPATLRAAAFFDRKPLTAPLKARIDALSLLHRDSHELKLCSNAIPLSLEDDAPRTGKRAVFLVDILNPCWIYPRVDMAKLVSVEAAVGQLPFNFQIGDDARSVKLRKPATPDGELEVHLDNCDGPRIATLPLQPAAANDAVTRLTAPLAPQAGVHDLCFDFTRSRLDPFWALDWVQLVPRKE